MRISKTIPHLKSRQFNSEFHLKIKPIRQEPRQKIRQLLRASVPLHELKQAAAID